MKKTIFAFALAMLLYGLTAFGQVGGGPVQVNVWIPVAVNPTGACSQFPPEQANYVNGQLCTCVSGTWTCAAPGGGGSGGTVTNFVDSSGLFSVATSTTTPTTTYNSEAQNAVLAGPATGGSGTPSFRALAVSDIPTATVAAASTVSQLGGDLLCAKAADQNVQTLSLTGSPTYSASNVTFPVASVPLPYYFGASSANSTQFYYCTGGTSGYPTCAAGGGTDIGPFTIQTAGTSTSIVASASGVTSPPAAGGVIHLACKNQVTDATSITSFSNAYAVPASYFVPSTAVPVPTLKAYLQYEFWTHSGVTAGQSSLTLTIAEGTTLMQSTAANQSIAGQSGAVGTLFHLLTSTGATSPGVFTTTFGSMNSAALVSAYNAHTQPMAWGTASGNLQPRATFNAFALSSITIAGMAGCTISGTSGQTVLLTAFNGLTNATATVTLNNTIVASGFSGASNIGSILVTNTGYGSATAPTSATCTAGTVASASGTATFTSASGGAQGDAVLLSSMVVTP